MRVKVRDTTMTWRAGTMLVGATNLVIAAMGIAGILGDNVPWPWWLGLSGIAALQLVATGRRAELWYRWVSVPLLALILVLVVIDGQPSSNLVWIAVTSAGIELRLTGLLLQQWRAREQQLHLAMNRLGAQRGGQTFVGRTHGVGFEADLRALSVVFDRLDVPARIAMGDDGVEVTDLDPPHGAARLGPEARAAAEAAAKAGAVFEGGQWRLAVAPTEGIEAVIAAMAAATRRMRDSGAIDRMIEVAVRGTRPKERLEALAVLAEAGPVPAEVYAAFARSPTPELRFVAADARGDDAAMRALLTTGTRRWRAEAALWLLGRGEDPAGLEAHVVDGLRDPGSAAAAAAWLAAHGSLDALARLAAAGGNDADAAAAAIRARLRGGEVGALALADSEGGELSLARPPRATE